MNLEIMKKMNYFLNSSKNVKKKKFANDKKKWF